MSEEPKPVAGIKLVETRAEAPPDAPVPNEPPIGKMMAAARDKRRLSQAELSRQAHIPVHYVRMIEDDDYTLIADQLYMLPFLRRYAAFVGLDAEDMASRFIRGVQRADASAARMAEPIAVIERHPGSWRTAALFAIVGAALAAVGSLAYHHFRQAGYSRSVATIQSTSVTPPQAAPPAPAVSSNKPAESAKQPAASAAGSAPSAAKSAPADAPAGAAEP
jgi:cytoskeleton protein RodZ